MEQQTQHFCFFLVPGYSLVALSCAIDVLRAANIEVEHKAFDWTLVADPNHPDTQSSSNISLPFSPIEDGQKFDIIVVCGGERTHLFNSRNALNWLKQQARKGANVGSISDGAYLVAKAALFNHVRSTIHWKCQSAYRELYPDLDIRTSILEVDGKRFSCAGGTSSLDLMLQFITQKFDDKVAGRIADNYFHDQIRGDDQIQHMTSALRYANKNQALSKALMIMENALEAPIPIHNIAAQLNMSHRQLDRIFRKYLGLSPAKHYRDMRLLRATWLLKQTSYSISEIAIGSGFQSSSQLSKFFKEKYSCTPSQYRNGG